MLIKYFNKIKSKYVGLSISAKAALWFLFCSILQKCISFITVPLFTRLLTTEQYGQYSLYNSWLLIFQIITTLQLTGGVFNKGMSKFGNDKDCFTSSMQGLTSLITIVCFVVYLFFHNTINRFTDLSTFITVAMFAELLVSPAMTFWMIRQRYDFNYISVIIASIGFALANPCIGLLAVYLSEEKGIARIISCILVQVVFGVFFYIVNLVHGKKLVCFRYWKFAIAFNLPLIPHYISTYILSQADRIMIQKYCGYSDAGIYSVAYSLALVMSVITSSINQALVPWVYRELEEKHISRINAQLNRISIFISFVIICFICFAPELIDILGGAEYASAVYAIPPIAVSLLFTFLYTLYGNIEFYYDANKFTMCVSGGGAILNIVLNAIFIPIFGYVAASYTTMICYFVFCYSHYFYMCYIMKKHGDPCVFNTKFILLLGCLLTLCGSAFSVVYKSTPVRYSIIIVALAILLGKRNDVVNMIEDMKKKV